MFKVKEIISIFLLIPLCKNNKQLYFVFCYFFVILILILFFLIIYSCKYIKTNSSKKKLNLIILSILLPILSEILYIPMIYLFLNYYDCVNGFNYVVLNLTCDTNDFIDWLNKIIFGLMIFLLTFLAYINQSLFYDFNSNIIKKNIVKDTSKPEVNFLIIKLIIPTIFVLLGTTNSEQWILLVALNLCSISNIYMNYKYQRFSNNLIMAIYKFFSLYFQWINISVLIDKVIKKFNHLLILIIIGIPLIFIIFIYEKPLNKQNLIVKIQTLNDSSGLIKLIQILIKILDYKNIDRGYKLFLQSYIYFYEKDCHIKDCPLKKYLKFYHKKLDPSIFLIQHIEILYQNAYTKYPHDFQIKLNYAIFLFLKLNKKPTCFKILEELSLTNLSLEESFLLYRYNKKFKAENTINDKLEEDNDTINELKYNKLFKEFKNDINVVSNLYLQFWNELLISNQTHSEDLNKLNEYGLKIIKLINNINFTYNKMNTLKRESLEVLKLYYDYLSDIINNKEQAIKIYKLLNETDMDITENKREYIDLSNIYSQDIFEFIILSTNKNEIGKILNTSLGFSLFVGYSRDEIIGKSVDIFIPYMIQKEHKKVLKEKLKNDRKKLFENDKHKNDFKEKKVYITTKSKYLVELNLKVNIIKNENNELFFIAIFQRDDFFYHTNHKTEIKPYSIIMTDKELKIKYFNADSINMLGINLNLLNSEIEIIYFIEQIYEEYLTFLINNENVSLEKRLEVKIKLVKKFYNHPDVIYWKDMDSFNNEITHNLIDYEKSEKYNNLNDKKNLFNKKNSITKLNRLKYSIIANPNFMLNEPSKRLLELYVKELKINGNVVAYIFKFQKTNLSDEDNINSTSIGFNEKTKIEKYHIDNFNPYYKTNELFSTNSNQIFNHMNKEKYHLHKFYTSQHNSLKKKNHKQNIEKIEIKSDFIPENNFEFNFYPENISYKPDKLNNNYKLNEILNKKVNEKYHLNSDYNLNNSIIEEIENEEYESSSDLDSVQYSEISKEDNVINKLKNKEEEKKTILENIIKKKSQIYQQNNDDYYHVNILNIKLYVYNYLTFVCDENKKEEKISEVEKKLNENHFLDKMHPLINIDQKNVKIKKTRTKKLQKKDSDISIDDSNNEKNILKKEIEATLSKVELHLCIKNLLKASFFSIFILICILLIIYFYLIYKFSIFKQIFNLITFSYKLSIINNLSIFYVKELVLLNNENYTNFPSNENRIDYINRIKNITSTMFYEMHKSITKIISTTLTFSKKNFEIINNTKIYLYNIDDNFVIQNISIKKHISYIEVNTALNNIFKQNINKSIPLDPDIFIVLYNNLENEYFLESLTYIDELEINKRNTQLPIIIGFIVIFLIYLLLLLLLYKYLKEVNDKKNSYIEIFLEIDKSIIKYSLYKCKNFLKKINPDKEDEIEYEEESEENHSFKNNLETTNKENNNLDEKEKIESSIKSKRKDKFKEKIKIILKIFIFFLFIFLYKIFISIYFFRFINIYEKSEIYFEYTMKIENKLYSVLNDLRSYLFDKNQKIKGNFPFNNLEENIKSYYFNHSNNYKILNQYRKLLPNNFKNKYHNLKIKKSSCSFILDNYFLNEEECFNFSNSIAKYGIDCIENYYIELIREAKNYFYKFIENDNLQKVNLTLKGTNLYDENYPINFTIDEQNPINYFNNEKVKTITIIFLNFLEPFFFQLKDLFLDCIEDFIYSFKKFINIYIFIYFSILLLVFFFIWIPLISELNNILHKTKKMLSIIPKEVLSNINNITKYLNIRVLEKNKKNIIKPK